MPDRSDHRPMNGTIEPSGRTRLDGSEILGVLAPRSRRRMLIALDKRPCTAAELAEAIDRSQSTVRSHLRKLADAGLIESRPGVAAKSYRLLAPVSVSRDRKHVTVTVQTSDGAVNVSALRSVIDVK